MAETEHRGLIRWVAAGALLLAGVLYLCFALQEPQGDTSAVTGGHRGEGTGLAGAPQPHVARGSESRQTLPGGRRARETGETGETGEPVEAAVVITVLRADQTPAAGITGAIHPLGEKGTTMLHPTRFVTDDRGTARVAARSGAWVLRVSADPSGWKKFSIADKATVEVRYVLPKCGEVRGVVVDGSGGPVPQASIFVSSTSSRGLRLRVTETSAEGEFALLLGRKTGLIIATAKGFAPAVTEIQEAVDDVIRVRMVLRPGARVRGTVTGPTGLPVAGCTVVAGERSRVSRWVGWSTDVVRAETDANGRFELNDVAVGVLAVAAQCEGFLEATKTVETREGVAVECELRLKRPSMLRGTVLSGKGDAVRDADVCCLIAGRPHRKTTTKPDGSFEFRDLRPGAVKGWARHADLGWGRYTARVELDAAPIVEVTLTPGVEVSGRVVDERGWALRSVLGEVAFVDPTGGTLPWREELVGDKEGRFSIGKVDARLELIVTASQQGYTSVTMRCKPGEAITLVLPRSRLDTFVTGRVVGADGGPVAGVSVMPVGYGQASSPAATTDKAGRFTMRTGIPRGPFSILLMKSGLARTSLGMFRAAGGKVDVGDLKIARGGRVRLQARVSSGRPVSTLAVLVDAKSGRGVDSFSLADGVGESSAVPPGEYLVNLSPWRFQTVQQKVRVEAGKVATVTMDMERGTGMYIECELPPGVSTVERVRVTVRDDRRTILQTSANMPRGKCRIRVGVGKQPITVEAVVGKYRATRRFRMVELPTMRLGHVLRLSLRERK